MSAVKSGERFTDESSVISYSLTDQEVKLLGNKPDAMKHFGDLKKGQGEAEGQKPSAVKSTFKIEINDDEKKSRDSSQTTLYHTGTGSGSTNQQ